MSKTAATHVLTEERETTSEAVELLVAPETQEWLEALYDSGAVTYDADGTVTVNARVRELVSEMHGVLAAGDADRKSALDRAFDKALVATSALGAELGAGVLSV